MNKLEIQGSGFPADNSTWRFLRDMINQVHELAEIGGRNYILKGCEVFGSKVSSGYMVLDGELIKFKGGTLEQNVKITQTIKKVAYLEDLDNNNQGDEKETYITRFAEFGNEGADVYVWKDLERLKPLIELQRRVPPAQTAIPYWGSVLNIKKGWQLCDGTNNTPNLSGMFIVGLDPKNKDYNTIGKQGGADYVPISIENIPPHVHKGTVTIPPHDHNIPADGGSTNSSSGSSARRDSGRNGTIKTEATRHQSVNFTTSSAGSGKPIENRPPYYTLAYITYVGL